MSDERCETCQHWRNPWDDDDDSVYPVGASRRVARDPEWGYCSKITLLDSYTRTVPDGLRAYTQDGSDYVAHLHTRSDFGCVLWTERGDA